MSCPLSIGDWIQEPEEENPGRTVWEGVLADLAKGGRRIVAEILCPETGETLCNEVFVYMASLVEGPDSPKYRVCWERNGYPYECQNATSWADGVDTACSFLGGVVGDLDVQDDPNWIEADAPLRGVA